MREPLAKERKSHITTVLPNTLLDELHKYAAKERVKKSVVIESALLRFLAEERAKNGG